jgi:16S rRNA (uracil1498-N3)-methyltransferase
LELSGPEAHHLGRVRRVRVGERVLVFDGHGAERWTEVEEVGKRSVKVRVLGDATPRREARVAVKLAFAPPKGKRLAWLVEKATELAATELCPLVTERGVVDANTNAETRAEKLVQKTIEAAKQCEVLRLPLVSAPASIEDVMEDAGVGTVWILDPGDDASAVPEALAAIPEVVLGEHGLTALIGPEGGFTEAETARALELGATRVRLAPTILRVETAAVALLAAVRALRG